jgi:hypothetical protein
MLSGKLRGEIIHIYCCDVNKNKIFYATRGNISANIAQSHLYWLIWLLEFTLTLQMLLGCELFMFNFVRLLSEKKF